MDGKPAALTWDTEWIAEPEALERFAALAATEAIFGLDTETVGWETGNERLALVQIGLPSKRLVGLIDALALKDMKPLEALLSSPTPQLVAHNAPFEERQFGRFGIKLRGIRDTLVLARKYRPDLPNHTLQTCVRHLLGVELRKEEQTSDWSLRPLSPEQLRYAALDAEIAVALHAVLAELEQRVAVNPAFDIDALMKDLAVTIARRLEISKPIAAELALLHAKEEVLRETIRTKLIDGAPAYEGDWGKASVQRIKRTEVAPDLVRQLFPEFAARVIGEHVERQRLLAVMREFGVPADKIDLVTKIIGYTDRLSLSVKDFGTA